LLQYKSSRAEALEKCKLPSKATTISTTVSESESKGNTTKEGDATSKETKQAKESKTIESMTTDSPEAVLRAESVQMVVRAADPTKHPLFIHSIAHTHSLPVVWIPT
jgi:Fic family protein